MGARPLPAALLTSARRGCCASPPAGTGTATPRRRARPGSHGPFAGAARGADLALLAGDLTARGEPGRLWGRLGAEALARPTREHRPDLVVHAHAHGGTFRGSVGPVPAFNVSEAVVGRELCRLDLAVA